NVHLAQVAEVVSDHRLFRERGDIADLVDVYGGIKPQRIHRRHELLAHRPASGGEARDFHDLSLRDRRGELEVKGIANAQVSLLERSVKDAAFEADGLHKHRLGADRYREILRSR